MVSLFCTPENGILIQDSFPLSEEFECLLGIEVPYHYFVRKVSNHEVFKTYCLQFLLLQGGGCLKGTPLFESLSFLHTGDSVLFGHLYFLKLTVHTQN